MHFPEARSRYDGCPERLVRWSPHPGLAWAPGMLPWEPQPSNNSSSWRLWGHLLHELVALFCFAQMISLNPQIPLKQPREVSPRLPFYTS